MPDAKPSMSIFNRKASEKLRNPDDLDKYIRVTKPSVWVVLLACVVLLAGLLAWGVFGTVATSVSAMATEVDGTVYCFLDAETASKVHVGDNANIDGEQMEVKSISSVPASRDEVYGLVNSDYLVATLLRNDWAYVVEFTGTANFQEGVPISANITTERMAPISLILGGRS